jgi:hypothetical protein
MQVTVPAVSRRLRLTQAMTQDFLCDPVLASKVMLGYDLDAFQRARLRYYWWVPFGIDDSGFSSGKTIVDWIYIALRCLLIPDHVAGVYYPTFQTGKDTFWQYFSRCASPIYRAHLGQVDDRGDVSSKSRQREPACYKVHYLNGSETKMPAPSFVKDANTQASLRLNTLLVEEWRIADAMGEGINKQLQGRTTRECWNQNHPVWANHIHFTAPAKDALHPSDRRWREIRSEVRRGNPSYFLITYSYKDYSDLLAAGGSSYRHTHRQEAVIGHMKRTMSDSEFLGECLGIRGAHGRALYPDEYFTGAREAGQRLGVLPLTSRAQERAPAPAELYYFCGVDPAPAQSVRADDGAIVVLRAVPASPRPAARPGAAADDDGEAVRSNNNAADWQLAVVYGRKVRNASSRQWSGLVHRLHQAFRFTRIGLDPLGGGQWIKKDLAEPTQLIENSETRAVPICTPDDVTVASADWILCMIGRNDSGIQEIWPDMAGDDVLVDRQHTVMDEAWRHGNVLLPPEMKEIDREEVTRWGEERTWAGRNLETLAEQFKSMGVALRESGELDLTKNNARKFISRWRKDFVSATLNAYTAFLVWLKQLETSWEAPDAVMFGGN